VVERLRRLAADQRAAATAPPGPVLCVAPAGSGKTTTLVARIAWLNDEGSPPGSICAITFNRRAAEELRARVDAALEPVGGGLAEQVRIRSPFDPFRIRLVQRLQLDRHADELANSAERLLGLRRELLVTEDEKR